MINSDFSKHAEQVRNHLAQGASINILENIDNYNDEMTISQVVRFFERHGLNFTKTMIQNYVRVGIIPPPYEKRYYTKKHLILLTMIDSLKDIYSLDEIGMLFRPVMADSEALDGDAPDIGFVYNEFQKLYDNYMNLMLNELPDMAERALLKSQDTAAGSDKNESAQFFTLLELMVHSTVIKKIVKNMIG